MTALGVHALDSCTAWWPGGPGVAYSKTLLGVSALDEVTSTSSSSTRPVGYLGCCYLIPTVSRFAVLARGDGVGRGRGGELLPAEEGRAQRAKVEVPDLDTVADENRRVPRRHPGQGPAGTGGGRDWRWSPCSRRSWPASNAGPRWKWTSSARGAADGRSACGPPGAPAANGPAHQQGGPTMMPARTTSPMITQCQR